MRVHQCSYHVECWEHVVELSVLVTNAKQPFVHKLASEFPRWPWCFTGWWNNARARHGAEAWTASGGLDHQGRVQLFMPRANNGPLCRNELLARTLDTQKDRRLCFESRVPGLRGIRHRGPGQQNLFVQDHTSPSRAWQASPYQTSSLVICRA